MSRLRHTFNGYLRSMQLSSTTLFVFVEGKQSDPFFYSCICETISDIQNSYEIILAEQLPCGAGGKQSLLIFFGFLREKKKLLSKLGNQKTTCVFFLDKDIDDIQRKRKRSPHLIYTEHYDVQNYIYLHGKLRVGAASAASVDPNNLNSDLSEASLWCKRSAKYWSEWISLCILMIQDGISCEANYKVNSQIQVRLSEPTDSQLFANMVRKLSRKASIPVAEFKQRLLLVSKKVERYFSNDQHHRIFKGKWFSAILADEIDKYMAGRPYDRNKLLSRLTCAIASTIDFKESWADYYRSAILSVAKLLY